MANEDLNEQPPMDAEAEHTHGSGIVLFRLYSAAAREWVAENLHTESWQWLSPSTFAVDWRYAEPIMAMMDDAGLVVR